MKKKMLISEAKTPDEIALFIENFDIQKEIMIEDIGKILPGPFGPNVQDITFDDSGEADVRLETTFESIKNKIQKHKSNNIMKGKNEYSNIGIFYDHIFDAVNGGDISEDEASELVQMLSPEGSRTE